MLEAKFGDDVLSIQNRRNIGQDESKLTYCLFQEIWLLGFSYHWHEVKQLGLLKILYI